MKSRSQLGQPQSLVRLLSRPTARSQRFIPLIDGLRCLAVGMVLLFHVATALSVRNAVAVGDAAATIRSDPVYWIFGNGVAGVWIFFAISGFVLALPFAEAYRRGSPHPTLRRYFLRRVLRIEPPYLICMACLAAGIVLSHHGQIADIARRLAASLTYSHLLIYGDVSPINRAAWSLEVEVHFYLCMPILALLYKPRSAAVRRGAMALIIIAAALFRCFAEQTQRVRWSFPGNAGFFIAGLWIADLWVTEWNQSAPIHTRPRWDGIFVAALALVSWPYFEMPAGYIGFAPFVVLLVVYSAFRGRLIRRVLSHTWAVTIGGMCYSIYLYHLATYETLLRLRLPFVATHGPFWWQFVSFAVVAVPVTIVGCALAFVLFEKPFMYHDWPRTFLARTFARTAREKQSQAEVPRRVSTLPAGGD